VIICNSASSAITLSSVRMESVDKAGDLVVASAPQTTAVAAAGLNPSRCFDPSACAPAFICPGGAAVGRGRCWCSDQRSSNADGRIDCQSRTLGSKTTTGECDKHHSELATMYQAAET
jgi:hypothetical protein